MVTVDCGKSTIEFHCTTVRHLVPFWFILFPLALPSPFRLSPFPVGCLKFLNALFLLALIDYAL
jgi:hypothetical protein